MRAPEERVYFALDRSLDHALMGLVLAIGVQALPRDPHAMINPLIKAFSFDAHSPPFFYYSFFIK